MPTPSDFPHLHLALRGIYEPKFPPAPHPNPEVDANRKNPKDHADHIRGILGGMQHADAELRRLRAEMGLPAIPADHGFLLRLPEGVDVDQLVRTLGVELVAETEEGLMLLSSVDLQFAKLEEVLRRFELGERGGGAGASLLDIYEKPDDQRRLQKILSPEVLVLWPLADTCRNRGTVQKDWAIFNSYELPEEFAIAVRSHIGWNHLEEAGTARYCLGVSFEVMKGEVPIYSLIESAVRVETEAEIEIKI